MNIIFDVHIANPNLHNEATMEQNIVLNEMYLTLYEGVKHLQPEIELEEMQNPEKPPAIVVYLKNKKVHPRKYSEELSARILAALNKIDLGKMWDRVDDTLKNLLN